MTELVVISLEPWDDVWRRNQYVLDGLLRTDPELRALFVEPGPDPLYEVRTGHRPRFGAPLRVQGDYGDRLHLLTPTKWLPRAVGEAADRMLQATVTRAVRRLGWRHPLLWINDPMWASMAEATGWPTLYDMTDDWVEADRTGRVSARLRVADAQLTASADVVTVCSTGLEQSRGGQRPVVLIANAVDVDRYRTPTDRPADLPATPAAVYVGTLHEDRLDVGLCVETGRALAAAGGTLALVGPNALSADNTAALEATPGVVVLGSRGFAQVPAYLQHADVLVVPHVVTSFTDSLDPIKLYEYLATGRPIVSTPVAGFRDSASPVVHVTEAADFAHAVVELAGQQRAAVEPPADLPRWSDRVEQFAEVLKTLS